MKIFAGLLMLFPVVAFSSPDSSVGHPAAAVFDFKSDWAVDYHVQVTDAGHAFASWLAHDLSDLDPIKVTDRQAVLNLKDHAKPGLGDSVTPADAKEMGQQLGADALVTGRIFKKGSEIIVAAKVVSSETGETQGTAVKGGPTTTLADLISQLSEQVGEIVLHQQGMKQVTWDPAMIVGSRDVVATIVPNMPREDIAGIGQIDSRVIPDGSQGWPIRPGAHDVIIYYYEGSVKLGSSVIFDVRPGASYEVVYDVAAPKGKRLWIQDEKTHQPVKLLAGSELASRGNDNVTPSYIPGLSDETPYAGNYSTLGQNQGPQGPSASSGSGGSNGGGHR